MDIQPTNPNQTQPPKPFLAQPFIRTMQKDIESLSKKAQPQLAKQTGAGQAAPPEKLPVAEPAKPILPLPPKPPSPTFVPKVGLGKPALMEKKPSKLAKEAPQKRKNLKILLISLAAILILGGLGGFLYWWNYIHEITPPVPLVHYECQNFQCLELEGEGIDQCLIDADCAPPEPEIPLSLIPVDETETIELALGQEDLLLEKLKIAATKEQEIGTLRRILIKLTDIEKKYLSFSEFCQMLPIQTPLLEDNFTLFFYAQAEGNRIGLVIETETLYEGGIWALLKNWEATIKTDLEPIFLETEFGQPGTEEFQDNIYQDIPIRYLNFPDPSLSIDYAIIDDKLVITTSRESMYAAIDALLATEIDISD